jgi:hypothetical protein
MSHRRLLTVSDYATYSDTFDITSQQCHNCTRMSQHIYAAGWTCLNIACSTFDSLAVNESEERSYCPEFVKLRPSCGQQVPKQCIQTYFADPAPADGVTTTSRYSRGFHCTLCGRMSSRYKWQCFECLGCGVSSLRAVFTRLLNTAQHSIPIQGRIRAARELQLAGTSETSAFYKITGEAGKFSRRFTP